MSDLRWPTLWELYRDFGLTPPKDFGQRLYDNVTKSEDSGVSEQREMTCREAGRKGGKVTAERHGPEFYRDNGKKGAQRLRDLIAEGRRAEQEGEDAVKSLPPGCTWALGPVRWHLGIEVEENHGDE